MHTNRPLSFLRVFIDPVKTTSKGQSYSVTFNGETIIINTRNPAGDACRYLLSQGHQGRMEMWDKERPYPRLVFHDIAKAAWLTVSENERHGPRIVRHEPMSDDQLRRFRQSNKPADDFTGGQRVGA